MTLTDEQLDQRLRRTFDTVAGTVDPGPLARPAVAPRRSRWWIGAGLAVAAVPVAAGAALVLGPEHVDRIPPPHPIVTGSIDGERYWVVDAFHTDSCDREMAGVEVVAEEDNVVGEEWNTFGYGPPGDGSCGSDASPDDPASAYFLDGGSSIGDGMLWMGWLPTDTDAVATVGGDPVEVTTLRHEGEDYFLLEVPAGAGSFTVEYAMDGVLVEPPPGETAVHTLP